VRHLDVRTAAEVDPSAVLGDADESAVKSDLPPPLGLGRGRESLARALTGRFRFPLPARRWKAMIVLGL
jgi:hypothetical protein